MLLINEEVLALSKRLEIFIAACFYYSGLVKLVRQWKQRSARSLVILNYHHASGGNLRQHLLYLNRHYRVLHLETALEELYAPYKSEQQARKDDRTPLVLTFDDGYYDNYTHGYALAQELHMPMTIFLIPGYIESGQRFWWYEGKYLAAHTYVDRATIEGRTYHLNTSEEREVLSQTIDARLRHATSVAEREQFLTALHEALNVPLESSIEERESLAISWKEAQKMQASGWVSFGAHTMHHPILAYLTDPAEMQCEVLQSRTVLEQQLGHPVRTFAYPVGQPEHIGEQALHAVKDAGYNWAVTTTLGFNTPDTDPYFLRRVEVDVDQHWLVVAAKTSGVWGFFSRLFWLPLMFIRKHLRKT